jgi:hypothetical protein
VVAAVFSVASFIVLSILVYMKMQVMRKVGETSMALEPVSKL